MKSKWIARLLVRILAIGLALFSVGALSTKASPADSKLTVSFQKQEISWQGVEFSLYLLTQQKGEELVLREPFSSYGVDLDLTQSSGWREAAFALQGYLWQNQVTPLQTQSVSEQGTVVFDALPQGIYLVPGQTQRQGDRVYETEPFLVCLPALDAGGAPISQQTVYPKWGDYPHRESVSYKVLKVWQDGGNQALRPEKIEVQLLCDGVAFDAVELTAANSWRYVWEDLDADHRWTVVESVPEGYVATLELQGTTFVLTNRASDFVPPPGEVPPEKLPQTGQLWWPVPLLASLGSLLVVWGFLRRRGSSHEE